MDKKTLRKVFLRKRRLLDQQEFERRNDLILRYLQRLLRFSTTVHLFLPIAKNREVDTWSILHMLWTRQKRTVVSITNKEDGTLGHIEIDQRTEFTVNDWGIPEPMSGENVEVRELDTVLVPLLCHDQKGHRIGYGKGYYDRFLTNCHPEVQKVGLSLLPPLDEIKYSELTDIKLDFCVTHLGIDRF